MKLLSRSNENAIYLRIYIYVRDNLIEKMSLTSTY